MASSIDPNRLKLTADDGSDGVLLGFRCRACGIHAFGASVYCQACTSNDLEPVELGREGTLYSYTVVRVPPPGWPGPVPYVLGQVELPEGPHVLAEVIDCAHEDLKVGLPVDLVLGTVEVEGSEDQKVVYKWRPRGQGR